LSGSLDGALPAERFSTRADFGSLALAGSGLGSGGFRPLDDRSDVPRIAQSVTRFLYVESCNQCSACKAGLRTASRALDTLFQGASAGTRCARGALFGARSAPQANRCYLPVQASVLLPALIERFRSQFEPLVRRPAESGPT
jgi:NADH:ubiquinone oxidoreductase subunit F (NADH-binding)